MHDRWTIGQAFGPLDHTATFQGFDLGFMLSGRGPHPVPKIVTLPWSNGTRHVAVVKWERRSGPSAGDGQIGLDIEKWGTQCQRLREREGGRKDGEGADPVPEMVTLAVPPGMLGPVDGRRL